MPNPDRVTKDDLDAGDRVLYLPTLPSASIPHPIAYKARVLETLRAAVEICVDDPRWTGDRETRAQYRYVRIDVEAVKQQALDRAARQAEEAEREARRSQHLHLVQQEPPSKKAPVMSQPQPAGFDALVELAGGVEQTLQNESVELTNRIAANKALAAEVAAERIELDEKLAAVQKKLTLVRALKG